MVRALFRSVDMGDQPALSLKVYYPALYSGTELERNTGMLPVATADAPYPLAVIMPGINVSQESYGWLARALVNAGFVAVIYGWILEEMPGLVSLTPGLDIQALTPEQYGKTPSATALNAVINDLKLQNESGPLAGTLNLDRIVLGGHSAGGSVALMNARPDWFPGLRAVFAYGSHSKASTMLGYAAETVLPLPDALPLLIMGGSEDGVIAASAFRYGNNGSQQPDAIGPLQRSFDEGVQRNNNDCILAIVSGANHFAPCWPADPATGRPFLDWPSQRDEAEIRQDIADLVCAFARRYVADQADAEEQIERALNDTQRYVVSQRK